MNGRLLSVLYCILVDVFTNDFKTAVIFGEQKLKFGVEFAFVGITGHPCKNRLIFSIPCRFRLVKSSIK